jgi:hypothetical protein
MRRDGRGFNAVALDAVELLNGDSYVGLTRHAANTDVAHTAQAERPLDEPFPV